MNLPEPCIVGVPLKTEGAGKTGCWLHPRPACNKKRRRQSPQVQPERPGLPCAMVLRLIRDLPGVPGLLATAACRSPPAGSIPASGDRDHTISPSASCRTPCDTPASIASRTQRPWRSRYAPPADEDRRTISMISSSDKQNYFFGRGLTRFLKISSSGKSGGKNRALKDKSRDGSSPTASIDSPPISRTMIMLAANWTICRGTRSWMIAVHSRSY